MPSYAHSRNHRVSQRSRSHRTLARLLPCLQPLEARQLMATYYVSASLGNDSYDGKTATFTGATSGPYATIAKAASVARAGDIVQIRSGTYRETVIPSSNGAAGSVITFQNYPGENPVISGADTLTGWTSTVTPTGSSVYAASMTFTMGGIQNLDDQLFINGQMLNYARYPNTSLDILHPTFAYAAAGTTGTLTGSVLTNTLVDPNLTQPAGYWNGAILHINPGPQWVFETPVVTNYVPGTITYTSAFTSATYAAVPGNPYWLSGKLAALDSAGEYYVDTVAKTAYLRTPNSDNPNGYTIEAKRRTWAFDLSNRRYITIRGLTIFAAGINTSSSSNNITIDQISASYVSHANGFIGNGFDGRTLDSGIVLAGSSNTFTNSEINFSAFNGVSVPGSSNTITGNFIHNVNYLGKDNAAIMGHQSSPSTNNVISFNTLSDSPRGLLNFRAMTNTRILNNRLFNAMLWTTDGAAMYTWNYPSTGIEIARNVISDAFMGFPGNPGAGIFFDGNAPGGTAHHNVVYNANNGLKNNEVNGVINYYNNTIVNTPSGAIYSLGTNAAGGIINNLSTNSVTRSSTNSITYTSNLTTATGATFVNTNAYNFQLAPGATNAIDAGSTIITGGTNYTTGAVGAPDIGAFEVGSNTWTAGTTNSFISAIPAAPSNLTATVISPTQINLAFTNNAANATRYIVDRGFTDSNGDLYFNTYAVVTNIASGTNTFSDTAAPLAPTYYRIRVDNGYTTSPYTYQAYAVARRDAYQPILANTVDTLASATLNGSGQIGSFDPGDWILFKSVDFQSGSTPSGVSFNLASPGPTNNASGAILNRTFSIRLDNVSSAPIGTVVVPNTGGFGTYSLVSAAITPTTGIHDVYLVGTSTVAGIANIRSLVFDVPGFSSLQVNDGSAQRSNVNSLVVNFTEPVSLPASAVVITPASGTFAGTVNVSPASGLANSFTITFSGTSIVNGSVPDGRYTLNLISSLITNAVSGALLYTTPVTFHRLFGDSNGDGRVNSVDTTAFNIAYGRFVTSPSYRYFFDFDGNGAINNSDLLQFRKRLNTSLF